jgi:hypothetical protein
MARTGKSRMGALWHGRRGQVRTDKALRGRERRGRTGTERNGKAALGEAGGAGQREVSSGLAGKDRFGLNRSGRVRYGRQQRKN